MTRSPSKTVKLLSNLDENPDYTVEVHPGSKGKTVVVRKSDYLFPQDQGSVGIITAGTSDIGVAEEAQIIADRPISARRISPVNLEKQVRLGLLGEYDREYKAKLGI